MARYDFTVLIEKDEDGMYVAEVPDLKGCYTQGVSIEEVLANMKEVIGLCVKAQKEPPSPSEFIGVQRIEVSA